YLQQRPTTEIYTLSLHDALPISKGEEWGQGFLLNFQSGYTAGPVGFGLDALGQVGIRLDSGGRTTKPDRNRNPGIVFPLEDDGRSEEHTSELQSRENLVCRLLLE